MVSVRPHCSAVFPVASLGKIADVALCNADGHVHSITRSWESTCVASMWRKK